MTNWTVEISWTNLQIRYEDKEYKIFKERKKFKQCKLLIFILGFGDLIDLPVREPVPLWSV